MHLKYNLHIQQSDKTNTYLPHTNSECSIFRTAERTKNITFQFPERGSLNKFGSELCKIHTAAPPLVMPN